MGFERITDGVHSDETKNGSKVGFSMTLGN